MRRKRASKSSHPLRLYVSEICWLAGAGIGLWVVWCDFFCFFLFFPFKFVS